MTRGVSIFFSAMISLNLENERVRHMLIETQMDAMQNAVMRSEVRFENSYDEMQIQRRNFHVALLMFRLRKMRTKSQWNFI